jgi:starch phosphorylase
MKFAMNGALTIGTLDGANVEIRDLVGADNFFLFGRTVEEISALQQSGYRPRDFIEAMPELQEAIRLVEMGHFSNGDGELFRPLLDNLMGHDPFYVMADFADYVRAQDAVSLAWSDQMHWQRMSLLNTARSGFFSSDRSIREYCQNIWNVDPLNLEITCDAR